MSYYLFPRHFDDIKVPFDDNNYEIYVEWLADHLYDKGNESRVINDFKTKERIGDAVSLGDRAWWHEDYCYEPFEQYIEQGKDYKYVLQEIRKRYDEIYEDEPDDDCKDDFNDRINPKVWENAKREYQEIHKIASLHIDMGYRTELRALLVGVRLHNNRYKILDAFFRSYIDASYK